MLKRFLRFSFIALFFIFQIRPLSPNANPDRLSPLNQILADFDLFVHYTLEDWEIPGAAIGIVHQDSIVFLKGYGVRKIGENKKIDANTVFRIASVSKGFASTLAGLLVDEGILHWDDRLIEHLPNLIVGSASRTKQMTLRHLVSHTTGIVPHAFDNLIESNTDYRTIVDELKTAGSIGPVGSTYAYQNVVYSLIGDVIEKAANESYKTLVEDRLFRPLGMDDASIGWAGLLSTDNRASPHIQRYYKYRAVRDRRAYYSVNPAAGVNASITDMSKWLKAQMGGFPHIIPPFVLEQIHTPVIRTPGERRRYYWNGRVSSTQYGLGWRIFDYAGHNMITHSGGIQGYLAQLAFIPEEGVGIVILFNSRRIDYLVPTFFDMFLGLDEPTPVPGNP